MSTAHEALSEPAIWEKDLTMIKQAKVVIAEVTNPSLGVGYEIAKAEEWGKPVLALYRPSTDRKLSAMILGSPHIENYEYTSIDQAKPIIEAFLGQLLLNVPTELVP